MRIAKALGLGIFVWFTGFVWGSIVFMTPALKRVPSIPYVSSNPVISFPLLILWPILVYLLARSFLKGVANKPGQGFTLGITLCLVNFVLDLFVLVFLLKAGFGYFVSLTVWLAYALLLIVPWLTGRQLDEVQ